MEADSGPVDKSRILDIKPLRRLVPVFPETNPVPPLVFASPRGPFPSGFTSFYPFSIPQENPSPAQNLPEDSFATPLRSFGPAEPAPSPFSNGDTGNSSGTFKDCQFSGAQKPATTPQTHRGSNSSQKKPRTSLTDGDRKLNKIVAEKVSSSQKYDGDCEVVTYVRASYDAFRRRLGQVEDARGVHLTGRRTDLRAGAVMMNEGIRTNMKKRIGAVPGVEIGDIFFFRMEMCLVGLHAPSMAGIDYLTVKDHDDEPLAVSIVSAGVYDDDADDSDVLIYSGHGGVNNRYRGVADQKLERGNLALQRSSQRANEIRVVRGLKEPGSKAKIYVYDGLYVIQESWVEKSKSGCNVFKHKLIRLPGQPGAFSLWKSIEKWREGLSSRPGLILPDLTSGAEKIPVSVVNEVDDERGPTSFSYSSTLKYSKSFSLTQSNFGCNCCDGCQPADGNCSCTSRNGGNFPYNMDGILVSRVPLLYECGTNCPCPSNCKNRVSQSGLKVRLEVFKTRDRGWGLRSWDPIRAGTFICEYAGEVCSQGNMEQGGEEGNLEYIFDSTRVYDDSFKWNCDRGWWDSDRPVVTFEGYRIPSPLVISSKTVGNVARFMNHCCSPNVFWQPILYEHSGQSFIHIAFFAMKHIPPLTELTYDYGVPPTDGIDNNTASYQRKKCLCGSPKCRGYYF